MAGRRIGQGWYLAVLLALCHLLSFADRNLLALLVEPIKAELKLSDSLLGLLQGTAFALFYGAALLPFGWLADRVSRTRLIAGALVVWSLATAATGLSTGIAGLFATRAVLGLAEAALVPAAVALLAAHARPGQLGRMLALFTGGASLGKGGALLAGGLLLAALGGMGIAPWRATFVAMALPGLILAPLMLGLGERGDVAPRARPSAGEVLAHLRRERREFALLGGATACAIAIAQALIAWAPALYGRSFGVSAAEAGMALGGVLLVSAPAGHLAGGMLVDWLAARGIATPARWVLGAGLAAAAPALWAAAGAAAPGAALLWLGVASFVVTLGAPAALAGVQRLAPPRLSASVNGAFLAATALLGIGLGPAAVGAAADLLGGRLGPALAATASCLALLGIGLLLGVRIVRQNHDAP
jgi:predicted MFS family arabinose efflux permease